jgi:protein-S-isoprenylcysteine O-methyltransferase Ste14
VTTIRSYFSVAARWTNFFEKYVLSLIFFKLAFDKVGSVRALFEGTQAGVAISMGSVQFATVLANVLMLLFSVFFGLNLLLNRKPIGNPRRWREIVIPLVATFILYAFTALAPYAPEFANRSFLTPSMQRNAIVTAIFLSLVGYAIALWSVAYLGRSLSIVVSVRSLVLRGPYRYVRHPMYLGYIFLVTGIAVASASPLSVFLWIVYLGLTIYRAMLEEKSLCAFSEEYRDYARRTGFLVPSIACRGRIVDS